MADNAQILEVAKTMKVTGVGSLVVTDIEQDASTGRYVREVRILAANDDGTLGRIILSVRVEAATRAGVEVRTPQLTY